MLNKTPLYQKHVELGALMVDFHGWLMPLQYEGIVAEHQTVRNKAGLFDVSHMGVVEVLGQSAYPFVQKLICNNLDKIQPGGAIYTPMCLETGGIIDDLIVYQLNREKFLFVVNSTNREKDFQWAQKQAAGYQVKVTDISDSVAIVAIQGPKAAIVLEGLLRRELDSLARFHFLEMDIADRKLIVARTGYTGEEGFEIIIQKEDAFWLWQRLGEFGQDFGVRPIGLGARDTLRLEKGYLLYGNDINEDTTPLEAGIGWAVDFSKEDFIGKTALAKQKQEGIKRKLVFLETIGRAIPRSGCQIKKEAEVIGIVTSGTFSPSRKKGIALAYLEAQYAVLEKIIIIDIRGKESAAKIVKVRR